MPIDRWPRIEEPLSENDTRARVFAFCYGPSGPNGRGRSHRCISTLVMYEGRPFSALLLREGWQLVREPGRESYYVCPQCAARRPQSVVARATRKALEGDK